MKQFSIKKILIFSFLLVTSIALIFILTQRYVWILNHEKESVKEEFLHDSEFMGKTIDFILNQRLAMLTQISQEVLKTGMNNLDKLQEIVESIHYRNPDFRAVWIGDANGKAIAFSPLYDKEGKISIGRDFSDREYYKRLKTLKKPVVGEIIIGRVTKEPAIPLTVPIIENDEFKGFVCGPYNPEQIQKIIHIDIKKIKGHGKGEIVVVDEYGRVVAFSAESQLEIMQDLSSLDIFVEAKKHKNGIKEYVSPADNRKKIGAFYNLENGWKIWKSRDVKEMSQHINESFYHSIFWGVLALLISFGVAYLLSVYLTKPIIEKRDYYKQFSTGKLDNLLKTSKYRGIISEIRELNDSFFEMAEELTSLYKGLETKVAERTKELEEANRKLQFIINELQLKKSELEEAKLEADRANKAKSDFLANMSHELRTPLNAIIGFSEVLVEGMAGPLNETQKEYLNDVVESGKHLLSLINDILNLSKIEAGKIELELSKFDLKDLIDRSVDIFKEKAIKHNIKILAKVDEGIDTIIADERMIKQTIFNLISNAMKFTPDGGSVMLKARVIPKDEGREMGDEKSSILLVGEASGRPSLIETSVEDTGIGISPEDQKKLFQPFQQLGTAITKKVPGTGLGLNLCKKFVELHGGRIWVESEVGKGSKFLFVIPSEPEVSA